MSKTLFAGAALCLLATAVAAGDAPVRKKPTSAPESKSALAPEFLGYYSGAHVDAGRLSKASWDLNGWYYLQDPRQKDRSAVAGVKAGYDVKYGSLVAAVGAQSPAAPSYNVRSETTIVGPTRKKAAVAMGSSSGGRRVLERQASLR